VTVDHNINTRSTTDRAKHNAKQEKKGRKLLSNVLALKRVDDPGYNFKFCWSHFEFHKYYTVEASKILPIVARIFLNDLWSDSFLSGGIFSSTVTAGRRWVVCDVRQGSAHLFSTSKRPFFQNDTKCKMADDDPSLWPSWRADPDLHGQNDPVALPLVPLPARRPLLNITPFFSGPFC